MVLNASFLMADSDYTVFLMQMFCYKFLSKWQSQYRPYTGLCLFQITNILAVAYPASYSRLWEDILVSMLDTVHIVRLLQFFEGKGVNKFLGNFFGNKRPYKTIHYFTLKGKHFYFTACNIFYCLLNWTNLKKKKKKKHPRTWWLI